MPDTPLTLVTQVGVPGPGRRAGDAAPEAELAYIQRNNLFGEKTRRRSSCGGLGRDDADMTSYILHTRVHLVLWGRADRSMASTSSVSTRRVGGWG